jgi:hypothetical protein
VADRQRHFTAVIEFTGDAQQLCAGLLDPYTSLRDISLQAGAANSDPFFIGDESNVSDTVYGTRMPPPSVTQAPYLREGFADGSVAVGEWWVKGSAGEKLHVDLVLYNEYSAD